MKGETMNAKKSGLEELYNLKESLRKQLQKERDEYALQLIEYKFVIQHIRGCDRIKVRPTGLTDYFERISCLKHVAQVIQSTMSSPELMRTIVDAKIKDAAKWHRRQRDLTQEIASCDFVIGCFKHGAAEAITRRG
jgi:hypothetical protein